MRATRHADGNARRAPPELRLEIMDRHAAFRECNYSLYPSWLAYPWPSAHLAIHGTGPYVLDRNERMPLRGSASAVLSPQGGALYGEQLDAAGVAAALHQFAQTAPQAAKALFNLNTTGTMRRVTGQLAVLGCRVAAVGKTGVLATLSGLRFSPGLQVEAGARPGGRLARRLQILVAPDTRVEFVLPGSLAREARRRPRPGQRIESLEPLPSVFTDVGTFRTLWPDSTRPHPCARYQMHFVDTPLGVVVSATQLQPSGYSLAGESAEPAPAN